MNQRIKTAIFSAAVAAVPLFLTNAAQAQYRLNENGHALDASNRVGSGGVNPNDSTKRVGEVLNGNDIVTGNVSGGKQFRGQVPYTSANSFRGANGSDGIDLDNFIKQSSGGTGPDARLAQQSTTFYGAGQAVAPPAGYTQSTPGSGAYLPINNSVARVQGDQRLGNLDLNNPQVALPQPGEMFLAGQVDPSAGQTYILASPTAGIRTFGINDINGFTSNTQYNPTGGKLNDAAIQRMRDELNAAAGATPDSAIKNGANAPNDNSAPATPGTPGANPAPGANPINQQPNVQANNAQPINNAVNNAAGANGATPGTYNVLTKVPPPEQQSAAYAAMLKQYQQTLADRTATDEQRARDYNNLQNIAKQEKDKAEAANGTPAQPGVPAIPPPPGAKPATPGAPVSGAPAPGASATGAKPAEPAVPDYAKRGEEILNGANGKNPRQRVAPLKIPSLAQGVKAKSISDYLKAAEASMKDGKFTAAFDDYDKAEQVAPNNPLIKLGRANAELGASYYARAEAHLRDVFTLHPELLVAQYDLTAMLGEQRLQNLVRDLKEISRNDQKESRPYFLLSYIAYNTGHEQDAQAYLDLADKRSDGKDPLYKLLRDNWSLPTKAAAPDKNK